MMSAVFLTFDSQGRRNFMSARSSIAEPGFVVRYGGRGISHHILFWPLQSVGWLVYGLMMLGYALTRES
jgi:hypothetical protein